MSQSWRDRDKLRKLYVDDDLSQKQIADRFDCSRGTVSRWLNKFDISTGYMSESEKDAVEINDRQHQIIAGMLMGDASIVNRDVKPRFRVNMCEKEFLSWLDNELEELTTGVQLYREAGYEQSGFTSTKTMYAIQSRTLEQLCRYAEWYEDGVKRWPVNGVLTDLMLEMLYVSDGNILSDEGKRPRIHITATNENDRKQVVVEWFRRNGYEVNWHGDKLYIGADQSESLFEKWGEPVPGFDYKWENP